MTIKNLSVSIEIERVYYNVEILFFLDLYIYFKWRESFGNSTFGKHWSFTIVKCTYLVEMTILSRLALPHVSFSRLAEVVGQGWREILAPHNGAR